MLPISYKYYQSSKFDALCAPCILHGRCTNIGTFLANIAAKLTRRYEIWRESVCERHARFKKRRKRDVEHRDRETWQNIRNEKFHSLQLRIQQSKRYFRKILFQLILFLPFQHLYSLFTSNQLQVAYAWSIQQLLANKSSRFFLSSNLYNISRFIASSLTPTTRVSILEGDCLLSLLSLVVP